MPFWEKAQRSARHTIYDGRVLVVVMLFIVLIAQLVFLAQARSNSTRMVKLAETNRQVQEQNHELLNEVQSCTNPNGTCARRGAKSTGVAIATINRITIYAAACAKDYRNNTVEEIQACVQRELAKQR